MIGNEDLNHFQKIYCNIFLSF